MNLTKANEFNLNAVVPTDYNFNAPFIDISYPKIMSYVPVYNKDHYVVSITDVRVQNVSKIELKLTLPEIKGNGIVSYNKMYPYQLLQYFEIYYSNDELNDYLLFQEEGEDIYKNLLNNPFIHNYLDYHGGDKDSYCVETKGDYDDCIIFPAREIIIPIELSLKNILIFPKTKITFKFKLNDLNNILSYNTVFNDLTLKKVIDNFKTTDLNIKLQFNNCPGDEYNKINEPQIFFLRKQKETGLNNTIHLNSKKFKSALGISFYNRTNIFNENNKFIINFGSETNEKMLINKWIKRILQDLIIISDKDMLNDNEKEKLGFSKNAIFTEVQNNTIYFSNDKRESCKIFIEKVPENHKIYYHKNILTFTRRFNKNNILNISNMFSFIKGIYFKENKKIYFFIDELKHNIEIKHVSIPVNIWTNENNTEFGDLRSNKSKKQDFIYNNNFIFGMDFLSKDNGFKNVGVSAGSDILEYYYDSTSVIYRNEPIKINKLDNNFYPHEIMFICSQGIDKRIYADKSINFEKFLIKVNWKEYQDFEPENLYKKFPNIVTYHLFKIVYDIKNHNISIEEV